MSQCLRLLPPRHSKLISIRSRKPTQNFTLGVRNCSVNPENAHRVRLFASLINSCMLQLVAAVKEKLAKEYSSLPVGRNGRDDDEMILWFLKDRRFSVEEAVSKLTKAIKWRHEFGVSELSEESMKRLAESGKAYVHDFLDVYDRPVLIVVASKHFPGKQDMIKDQQLCVYMIEKALSKHPDGKQEILAIIDLREFRTQNADINFVTFVVNANCFAMFLTAPYSGLGRHQFCGMLFLCLEAELSLLVKFCSVDDLRKEYFAADKVPAIFRD
ncbi:Sec14p-like phosphatidylinositol transfer family protein isoform 1 [Dorcoceras hygrometricum]|nr:Sec14p-like phosphatidylinositol transfer family protein isoform 1 [Dorcoceras hygrometricum]